MSLLKFTLRLFVNSQPCHSHTLFLVSLSFCLENCGSLFISACHSSSADVFGGSVHEPLEPGGDGEEGSRELPHSPTADHQEDQRGGSAQSTPGDRVCLCTWMSDLLALCLGSGAVSVWAGGSSGNHVLLDTAAGTFLLCFVAPSLWVAVRWSQREEKHPWLRILAT